MFHLLADHVINTAVDGLFTPHSTLGIGNLDHFAAGFLELADRQSIQLVGALTLSSLIGGNSLVKSGLDFWIEGLIFLFVDIENVR